jgi:ammonium transporter, Amt family
VKYWIKIDDSMDVFAEHGVAGIIGLLLNAFFASDDIIGLDGVNTGQTNPTTGTAQGGWIIHNYRQLYIQIAYIVATCAYAFVVSAIIAYVINITPGLHLRASEEAELLGMDDDQLGEFAYDYVEVRRDYLAWTPQKAAQLADGHEIPHADRYGIEAHSTMMEAHTPEDKRSEEDIIAPESSYLASDYHHHTTQIPPAPRQVAEQNPPGEGQAVVEEEKSA